MLKVLAIVKRMKSWNTAGKQITTLAGIKKKKKNENHSYNYHVKRSPHYYCQDLSEYWLDKIRKVFSG